ncbi:MAG: hypothetical protein QM708_11785 [Propioniciclava sp.]|uniref:hypothetical protein n=1 Tax=Propioniciclava sp. TaxID=2038686 RepID=UPI0039E651C3
MDDKGWAAGYEAAAEVAAHAHVVSSGNWSPNRIRPVIAEDLRHLQSFGRLPRVACPFPVESASRRRPPVTSLLVGAVIGALLGIIASGVVPHAQALQGATQAMAGVDLGWPVAGLLLGVFAGWCWAVCPRKAESARYADHAVSRARMSEYWSRREKVRSELERGVIAPAEAAARITQYWGIDCV